MNFCENRAGECRLLERGCVTVFKPRCRVLTKLMLFNKTIKTLMVCSAFGISLMSPTAAQATSCNYASFYGVGDSYHGRKTASGERFNAYGNSTAHRSLPFGTKLKVTNPNNGRTVIVKVNDRGPFVAGRSLDLSYGAFSKIASPGQGVVKVCYAKV
jgi:rare lipoprotein A